MGARIRRRGTAALAAALLGLGSLSLAACGDDEADSVQPRQVGSDSDKIGDAGLAPEEQAGGVGESRGTGGQSQ